MDGELHYFSSAVREAGVLRLNGFCHYSPRSVTIRGSKTVGYVLEPISLSSIQTDISQRRYLAALVLEIQAKRLDRFGNVFYLQDVPNLNMPPQVEIKPGVNPSVKKEDVHG